MKLAFLLLPVVALVADVPSKPKPPDYTIYSATLARMVSGDVAELNVYLGLGVHKMESVKLMCVKAPRVIRGRPAPWDDPGTVATQYAESWMMAYPNLILRVRRDNERDEYGRLVAMIYSRVTTSLNRELIWHKLAESTQCDEPERSEVER